MLPAKAEIVQPAATTHFNRWLIPIAAVAIHICIGSVYSWSIFNRPILALLPGQPWWNELGFVDASTQVTANEGHTLYMTYLRREVKPTSP